MKTKPQPIRRSPMMTETRDGPRFSWPWRSKAPQTDDDDGWRDYDHGFRDGYQAALREASWEARTK